MSVLILSTASDLHLKYKLGRGLLKREGRDESAWLDTPVAFYREANIRLITDAIRYARSRGIERIEFAAEDASRGDLRVRDRMGQRVHRGRRHEVLLFGHLRRVHARRRRPLFPAHRRGARRPEGARAIDRALPQRFRPRRHQHRARRVARRHASEPDGERHRGTRRQHVDSSVRDGPKELYGVTLPRFNYERLHELRDAIERASGVPMQPHEPIVGEGVFSHESGIHTGGDSGPPGDLPVHS